MKKRGIMYRRLLLSLMGMLLIPLSIISVFYVHLYQKMERQVKDSNSNFIGTVANVCDKELAFYQENILRIAVSQNLNEMQLVKKYDRYSYIYHKYLFQQELRTELSVLNMNKNYCADIFVYFGDPSDGLISCSGVVSLQDYISTHVEEENYEDIEEFISNGGFKGIKYIHNDGTAKNWILLTTAIKSGEDKVIVGLWLDMEALINIVGAMSWQNGMEFVVLDEDNCVISSSFGDEGFINQNIQVSSNGISEIDNVKYLTNIQGSQTATWKYALMTPVSTVYEGLKTIRNVFAICILMCILIGYRLSIKTASYNYDPIEELIGLFDNGKESALVRPNFDEYSFLRDKAESLITSGEHAKKQIKKYRADIRTQYFTNLLHGVVKQEVDIQGSTYSNEKFSVGKCQVAVVHWKTNVDYSLSSQNDLDLCKFAIMNVFGEGLEEVFECEMVALRDNIAIILLVEEDMSDFDSALDAVFERSHDFLLEKLQIETWTSIGEPHEGVKGIHESYMECLEVQGFFKALRENCIRYRDIKEKRHLKYKFSFEREERIVSAIRENDIQTAAILIEEVLREVFTEDLNVGLFERKCVTYDLYCMLLKLAAERGVDLPKSDVLGRRLDNYQWQDIGQQLTRMTKLICENEGEQRIDINKERCLKIKDYIEENFQDINLNVSQIGAHFEMSPSYLSSLYRKEMGESLVTVINKVRVKNAALLLKKGNTVNETALLCGFTDCSAFIRIFKKYMEITPGQYKNKTAE